MVIASACISILRQGKEIGRCGKETRRRNSGVFKDLHSVGLLDWFRNFTRFLLPLATCGIAQVNPCLILFVKNRNTTDNPVPAVILPRAHLTRWGLLKSVAFGVVWQLQRLWFGSISLKVSGRSTFIRQNLACHKAGRSVGQLGRGGG